MVLKKERWYYINGINPATARKIVEYVFKIDYVSLKENRTERTYDVFLRETANKEEIKKFKEFFGDSWKFYMFTKQK